MRVLLKFQMPTETGNEVVRSGTVGEILQEIVHNLHPEAMYFAPDHGLRSGFMVFDLGEPSQIAEIAERFYFALHASVELTPIMTADDLQKALPAIEAVVRRYGSASTASVA